MAPNDTTQAFEILQNTVTSLQAEVVSLSQPVSSAIMAVAGELEDQGTNAPLVVKRLDQQVATVRQKVPFLDKSRILADDLKQINAMVDLPLLLMDSSFRSLARW